MNKEKELLEEHVVTPAISEEDSNFLALLPLKNVVLLPKSILPIIVGRPSSIRSVEYALKHNKIIFISAQKDPNIEQPTQDDIYQYGTRATILQVMRMPNGSLKILVEGIGRARILESDTTQDFTCVHIEDLPTEQPKKITEQEAGWRTLKDLYLTYSKLNEKAPQDLFGTEKTTEDIDYIVDTIAVHLNLSFDERQKVLEAIALKERMMIISMFLKKEIEILEIEQRIKGHIQTQVEKNQREYYLTEQIKAIHKELGREDQQTEFAQLKETIMT
jgi:ATP-dependent Lon protease